MEYGNRKDESSHCFYYEGIKSIKIGDQKLFNDKIYNEILLLPGEPKGEESSEWINVGYMREEEGKVYYYHERCISEIVIYDFYLKEGDKFTLNLTPCMDGFEVIESEFTLTKIEEVVINNKIRKRYSFDDAMIWIEGLGSTEGLLYFLRQEEDLRFLKACSINKEFIYYNTDPGYCMDNKSPVFPLENAKWVSSSISDADLTPRHGYYCLQGDTIIDHVKRAKAYSGQDVLVGYFYVHDEQVYFRGAGNLSWIMDYPRPNEDLLLYDFGLSVGDKIPDYVMQAMTITAIENIPWGEGETKRFTFGSVYSIIRGMGHTKDLFTPVESISTCMCWKKLIEFSVNGEVLYSEPDWIVDSIDDVKNQPIDVSYNKNEKTLIISSNTVLDYLEIINIQGQLLLHKDISETNEVDCNGLPKGIYLYRISGKNDIKQSGKIIVW